MRYILALVPLEEQKSMFTQAAQSVFSTINDGYLLTESISLPHITINSFLCADERKLSDISDSVQKWQINSCPVRILGLLLKKGKVPPNHYSVSLSVARDSSILHLHHLSFDLLQNQEIQPLNPTQDLYQPHITLAGIQWLPSEIVSLPSIINDLIAAPVSPFHLALGRSDEIGQYLETLFEF